MKAEACRAAVRSFYADIWNRRDEDRARELLAPDLRFRGSLGPEKTGIEGFLEYVRDVTGALADYRCEIESLVAEDGKVAAKVLFSGRHTGRFLGFEPTGATVEWTGTGFFSCAGGRIETIWVLGDVDGLRASLAAQARETA